MLVIQTSCGEGPYNRDPDVACAQRICRAQDVSSESASAGRAIISCRVRRGRRCRGRRDRCQPQGGCARRYPRCRPRECTARRCLPANSCTVRVPPPSRTRARGLMSPASCTRRSGLRATGGAPRLRGKDGQRGSHGERERDRGTEGLCAAKHDVETHQLATLLNCSSRFLGTKVTTVYLEVMTWFVEWRNSFLTRCFLS